MSGFTETDVPDQSGKCHIVTGANSGVGFEISRALAARGARVLLACRDKGRAELAMARIKQAVPQADLAFLPLDQADLHSVRKAAAQAANEPRLDTLVNNAGVMSPLERTAQDFEAHFGVNHLGVFALTALLLPKLVETDGSRVVLTGSLTHRSGRIDWDDLNAEKSFDAGRRYAASKLATLLFLFELDRRLRADGVPVLAVGCHPGGAATEMARRSLGPARILMPLMSPLMNSAAMGAWPALQATTGEVKPGGYYGPTGLMGTRGPSGEAPRSKAAREPAMARRLWDLSVSMTGIDPGLPPAPEGAA